MTRLAELVWKVVNEDPREGVICFSWRCTVIRVDGTRCEAEVRKKAHRQSNQDRLSQRKGSVHAPASIAESFVSCFGPGCDNPRGVSSVKGENTLIECAHSTTLLCCALASMSRKALG